VRASWHSLGNELRLVGGLAVDRLKIGAGHCDDEFAIPEVNDSNRIEHGRTVAHIATFLMRTETEVREKAAELGLTLPD
jgi:hypothetical protein